MGLDVTGASYVTSDELKLAGSADRLTAASGRQLAVDVFEVRLDGMDGDVQLARDFSGPQQARCVSQHLPLAFSERLDHDNRGLFGAARRSREPIMVLG